MTDLMSMLDCRNVPPYRIWICRVEVLLDLLLGDTFRTYSVGELHTVVTVDERVVIFVLEYVHHMTPTDEVVDTVLDLLW